MVYQRFVFVVLACFLLMNCAYSLPARLKKTILIEAPEHRNFHLKKQPGMHVNAAWLEVADQLNFSLYFKVFF